jgi:uncharacterized protein with GYD domain
MIFVTTLDLIPGKNDELRKIIKNLKVPDDIKIKEFLSLFGKPDYLVIFDAPNEERAMAFVLRFAPVTVPKTALGFPVDKI